MPLTLRLFDASKDEFGCLLVLAERDIFDHVAGREIDALDAMPIPLPRRFLRHF